MAILRPVPTRVALAWRPTGWQDGAWRRLNGDFPEIAQSLKDRHRLAPAVPEGLSESRTIAMTAVER